MKYKWKKYNLWIFYIIITVITVTIMVILHYVHPNTYQENARYILSAISQSLAAMLALTITVMFMVAPMAERYSVMRMILFNLVTMFSMIVFGTGIILPLFALKFGWFCIGVNLSIVVAIFCILSLFPFLRKVSDVLMYDIGYVILYGKTLDAIKSENETKTNRGIIELESICKYAIEEFRENVVKNILIQLSIIGKKSVEKRFEYATHRIADVLRDKGIESIDKGFDDMMTVGIAVDGLGAIGVETAKNRPDDWWTIALKVTDSMESVGIKAIEEGFEYTTIHAVRGLKDVIVELRRNTGLSDIRSKYVAANAVQGVWCLGGFVTKYMPERAGTVIQNLKEIEKEIGKDLLMKWEKNCVNKYPDLKSSFEEFKRGYNGG